jgi:hypothetical protein
VTDHPRRSDRTACLFCGGEGRDEFSLLSKFFARRALGGEAEVVETFRCRDCESRFFKIDIADEALGRLYSGYRGEEYFRLRHGFEPWYTRAMNDGIGGEGEFSARRKALLDVLARAGIANRFGDVLDHGGDRGQMIVPGGGLDADRPAVFEVSGVAPEPGVEAIGPSELHARPWDLILSCHVLEHVNDPGGYMRDLVGLGRPGSLFFVEVPNEQYASPAFNGSALQKAWLSRVAGTGLLFKALDFLSTGLRVKLGLVPPFGFVALREHLQIVTVKGLRAFLARFNLEILACEIAETGHIVALARKV